MDFQKLLSRGIVVCVSVSVLLGPWFFGAWETWWFWPFLIPVFAASLLLGLQLILCPNMSAGSTPGGNPSGRTDTAPTDFIPRPARFLVCGVPFLVYAYLRFLTTPVYIDAERSFLLFLSSWLLMLVVLYGLTARQRQGLFAAICINLVLIGLYGWINHRITGSRLVLWADGFPQYYGENRASACFFCPDHFSGAMEFCMCLGLGFVFGGAVRFPLRLAGCAMCVIGLIGVVMSKSRGGGMTLVVIAIAASIWGLTHLPRKARWWWRLSAFSCVLMLILLFASLAKPYMSRFGAYFDWSQARGKPATEAIQAVWESVRHQSRPQMYGAAIRAWKTAPWLGIGPGMHESVWPRFGPTADGDPENAIWPSRVNLEQTSNEVHSDWLELLEEFGVVGFALFLVPFVLLMLQFVRAMRQDPRRERIRAATGEFAENDWADAIVLGVFLALVAITFHSLGDFNLQIPALAWVMASLTALGFAAMQDNPTDPNSP